MLLLVPTSPVCSSEPQNSRTEEGHRGMSVPVSAEEMPGAAAKDECPKEPGRMEEKSCCSCRNGMG